MMRNDTRQTTGADGVTAPHATAVDDVLRALDAAEHGLAPDEARVRLERHGPNRLTERKRRGPLARFVLQFHNVLIYVLLAAAAVTAALGHWVDTGVIVGVVVINAIVGFIQEGKAEQALAAIGRLLSLKATVLRDGHHVSLDAEELVPGDVVLIQSGDRVPADLRLLRVKNLRVEEAALTGESVPVEKQTEAVAVEATIGDRSCMAYCGTLVTYGQGRGVVVATGDATELGRISGMLAEVERLDTPLLRKMAVFGRWLSVAIVALAAAVFVFGVWLEDYSATEMFMAAVGLAVAAISLGMALPILPVQILWVNMVTAVTLALALAFEPTEPDTMRRPPRDPRAPIFSGYFLWRTALVTAVLVAGTLGMFLWELRQGASEEVARTAAINTLVVFEAFYLLNTRFLLAASWPQRVLHGNLYVPLAILLVMGLQLLFTYAPLMQQLFHSAALGADAWRRIVSIGLVIYVIVEIEKAVVRGSRLNIG